MRRRYVVLALFAEVVFAPGVSLVALCETATCCRGGHHNGCVLRKTLGGLEQSSQILIGEAGLCDGIGGNVPRLSSEM